MPHQRVRWTTRRMMLSVAFCAVTSAYVGSYDRLSRRSMAEAREWGFVGLLYVSPEEWRRAPDDAIRTHYRRATIYFPVNCVDRWLRGTPPPVSCFLRGSGWIPG
ncbi:MAG: hypothetical protein U0835_02910 [Isosphaeraceae bacterium]